MPGNLLYVFLLIVLLLAAFIVLLFGTQVKGWMGEKAVAIILPHNFAEQRKGY